MDWQLTSVMVAVSGAIVYLAWTALRTWRGEKAGCKSGCACVPETEHQAGGLISPDELSLRRRRAPH